MKNKMYLQMFAEPGGGNAGGDGGQGSAGSGTGTHQPGGYTFEQMEEVASARAAKAERAAIADYLRKQGVSEDEITSAIAEFKDKREKSKPDVAKLTKEKDDALAKVERYENEKFLSGKHVRAEDMDYVLFKVSKMVDDKTTFEKAADKFLKENPRYAGQGTYRVSTGSQSGGGQSESVNDIINTAIREAFKR